MAVPAALIGAIAVSTGSYLFSLVTALLQLISGLRTVKGDFRPFYVEKSL